MFYGVSHVDVPVRDLRAATELYTSILGFELHKEGTGWVDLDAGSCFIRLIQSDKPERAATFRVSTPDVEKATEAAVAKGFQLLYEPMRTDDLELFSVINDADGNRITLWRDLTEDEYGFDPEIPKNITWDDDADALLRSLLRTVPALFRALARRKVAKNAEYLAKTNRKRSVDKLTVVRSYIMSQSKPNRYRCRQPLIDHGYDPDDYKEEFEA